MGIVVYWLMPDGKPGCGTYHSDELSEALSDVKDLRDYGYEHVTLSLVHEDSVGKPGVDSIKDGKLPNGEEYTWKKRR